MKRNNSSNIWVAIIFGLFVLFSFFRTKRCEKTKQEKESPSENIKTIQDQYLHIRREHFFSEALIYFIASGTTMQVIQKEVSTINLGFGEIPWFTTPQPLGLAIAFILLGFSVLLFILSFIHKPFDFSKKVYGVTSSSRAIPYLIFVYNWITIVGELIHKEVTPIFVSPYFYLGIIVMFLIPSQQIFDIYQNRKQKRLLKNLEK